MEEGMLRPWKRPQSASAEALAILCISGPETCPVSHQIQRVFTIESLMRDHHSSNLAARERPRIPNSAHICHCAAHVPSTALWLHMHYLADVGASRARRIRQPNRP
jgi:hypothetical protein